MEPTQREPKWHRNSSGLKPTDFLFIFYEHRIKIVLFSLIGLAAAATYYFLADRNSYIAQAKLLIRYVVERTAFDPSTSSVGSKLLRHHSANVVDAEMQILSSSDLALMVVDEIGVEKLGALDPSARESLAASIVGSLEVEQTGRSSDVILVSYEHSDPALAVEILEELIDAYIVKHLEIHRSVEQLEILRADTDVARNALRTVEEQLNAKKNEAGIISLDDLVVSFRSQMTRVQEDLITTNAELAEQAARVGALRQSDGEDVESSMAAPDRERVQEYRTLVDFLEQLRKRRLDYLAQYHPKSRLVSSIEGQIADTEAQLRQFESRYPGISARGGARNVPDLLVEEARLAAIAARQAFLDTQLTEFKDRLGEIGETAQTLYRLERSKEAKENRLRLLESRLEEAEVDEKVKQMGTAEIPNIGIVQRPALFQSVIDEPTKVALMIAGGGIAFGVILALFIELFLDRTIKRPHQIEQQVNTPPISILPRLDTGVNQRLLLKGGDPEAKGKRSKKRKRKKKKELVNYQGDESLTTCPWSDEHFVRPYSDAIRDRLGYYFQINHLTHKPKLIGVTAFDRGAGTSTLASSLAASFSEPGYGKVLLVDMNGEKAETHSFFEGAPVWALPDVLQTSLENGDTPAENGDSESSQLFLARADSELNGRKPLKAKEFYDLIPQLKLSDFDFIIFDMPPIGPTSPTTAMAGFMDKTLLIVEAGETNQADCKRGYAALAANKADVSLVLNKVERTPSWLPDQQSY